jgi:hypothetical protein
MVKSSDHASGLTYRGTLLSNRSSAPRPTRGAGLCERERIQSGVILIRVLHPGLFLQDRTRDLCE